MPEPGVSPSEQDFEAAADRALRQLERAINDLGGVEADLESGILTVEFEDGVTYIINSHRAARQIWMAADHTAWHFDYAAAEDRWIASKSGDELWSALEGVVGKKLSAPIALPR